MRTVRLPSSTPTRRKQWTSPHPSLVGIDGSPASEAATALAFDEASRRGVDLVALHAWSDVGVLPVLGMDWKEYEDQGHEVLGERLAGWHGTVPRCAGVGRRLGRSAQVRSACDISEEAGDKLTYATGGAVLRALGALMQDSGVQRRTVELRRGVILEPLLQEVAVEFGMELHCQRPSQNEGL